MFNIYINDLFALRLVYTDYHSSHDKLLEKDGSYKIHQRSLQQLATEIYKFKHNLGPEMLNEFFEPELSSYNTRSDNIVRTISGLFIIVLKQYRLELRRLGV